MYFMKETLRTFLRLRQYLTLKPRHAHYIGGRHAYCLYANDQSRPYSEAGWATHYTLDIDQANHSIVGGVIGTGEI